MEKKEEVDFEMSFLRCESLQMFDSSVDVISQVWQMTLCLSSSTWRLLLLFTKSRRPVMTSTRYHAFFSLIIMLSCCLVHLHHSCCHLLSSGASDLCFYSRVDGLQSWTRTYWKVLWCTELLSCICCLYMHWN